MIKKIYLFMPPSSQYGVLHHFTKKLCEALTRLGINCKLLQAEYDNPKPFLTEIFQDPPDCTLSFNGLLPDAEGRFFCDMIQIPHVACLVDSPNHFFPLIKSPYSIITCVDRFSCDFFKGMNFNNVLFMPHGVEKHLTAPNTDEQRPYDVVFLGSCIDYEAIRERWKDSYPDVICEVLEEAAELSLSDQTTSYVQAFVSALDRKISGSGLDPQKIEFISILDDLEQYIRGLDRIELLKSIKDAKVQIFGSGNWKKYLGDRKNFVIHDSLPYERALEIMKHTKILLNSCPWIKNGTHERILAGLACGALVITNENIFMREHFKDGESIVFYRFTERNKVNDMINLYLKDETLRENIVRRGRDIVMREHTWDQRAATLLKELPPILKHLSNLKNA